MKASINSILTTVQVNDYQVDLCYDFKSCELEIFCDTERIVRWYFVPTRMIYNHMNMITLACEAVEKWEKRKKKEEVDPFKDY